MCIMYTLTKFITKLQKKCINRINFSILPYISYHSFLISSNLKRDLKNLFTKESKLVL